MQVVAGCSLVILHRTWSATFFCSFPACSSCVSGSENQPNWLAYVQKQRSQCQLAVQTTSSLKRWAMASWSTESCSTCSFSTMQAFGWGERETETERVSEREGINVWRVVCTNGIRQEETPQGTLDSNTKVSFGGFSQETQLSLNPVKPYLRRSKYKELYTNPVPVNQLVTFKIRGSKQALQG